MEGLATESRNVNYLDLDLRTTKEILEAINNEDKKVAFAVENVLPEIVAAVDSASQKLDQGGRIFYIGAGTSGRIAEMDASEIAPTYGMNLQQWLVLQSGTVLKTNDGSSEDFEEGAVETLRNLGLNENDVVFGIAASGRTPFVVGALRYAKSVGALTISLSNNRKSPMGSVSDFMICCEVGPEVVQGSTRMKAGTSQKLILNSFSTALMVKQGRTFGNLMSHMRVANEKLIYRAQRILIEATNCDSEIAESVLAQTNLEIPLAIICILSGSPIEECRRELERAGGRIRVALKQLGK